MSEVGLGQIAIVGAGRLGTALTHALRGAGAAIVGPLDRRTDRGSGSDEAEDEMRAAAIVLLCVPDRQISAAAAAIRTGPIVGHCSGSLSLEAIAPHEGFSFHPLTTVTKRGAHFRGATAAIAGTTARARDSALGIARLLGMETVEIAELDRAAYHAAASMASNFLVTLESAAARIGSSAGLEPRHLVPLARAALDSWDAEGPDALTGPIVRGDDETVARQRAAVERVAPELVGLWDALAHATRALAEARGVTQRPSAAVRAQGHNS